MAGPENENTEEDEDEEEAAGGADGGKEEEEEQEEAEGALEDEEMTSTGATNRRKSVRITSPDRLPNTNCPPQIGLDWIGLQSTTGADLAAVLTSALEVHLNDATPVL